MKNWILSLVVAGVSFLSVSCDAFSSLMSASEYTSQGTPYEMIVVCDQDLWQGEAGDSLRAVLCAPVDYLPQREPLFDVLRILPEGFRDMIAAHRNVLRVVVDPSVTEAKAALQHDVNAAPQLFITLQAPDAASLTAYVSEHRKELVQAFENAERDRALKAARRFKSDNVEKDITELFGFRMPVPTGYFTADKTADFMWARKEYPSASQGFMIYTYPYEGKQSLSAEALLDARNRFAAQIPGPRDGSYMTTSKMFPPQYRMFRMEGRLWCELRGFWDVEGDYMGGPFVSYSTLDTRTNRVVTIDLYIYSPDLAKRNFMRGVEHLFYGVEFPK